MVSLGALVALFAFARGPIWNRVWEPDASILWSYAPIPIVVAALQAWNRRWTPARWLVASFVVAGLKYLITAGILIALLSVVGSPPRAPARSLSSPVREIEPLVVPEPDPTPLGELGAGTIGGIVTDEEGRPFAGALVHVRSGLEGLVFAKAPDPLRLEIRGWSYAPPILGLRVGQPLLARSGDGRMHTLNALDEGKRFLFNAPVLAEREIRFEHPRRHVEMHCSIHTEERGFVGVFAHPFFQVTDSSGRFELRGVPAVEIVLAVWNPNFAEASQSLRVERGGVHELKFQL